MSSFLPYVIYYFYRILLATWRIRIDEHPDTKNKILTQAPLILAHWHGDEYALFYLVKKYKLATITSTSKDGNIVDFVIRKLDGATSRGSSTRGGAVGLRGLIRLVKSGRIASIAVDGPRGPIYEPKPGVFELSKLCSANIIPVGVSAKPSYIFKKAWNKAYLPLPFAKINVYLGAPLNTVSREQDAKEPRLAQQLKVALNASRQQSAKVIATK